MVIRSRAQLKWVELHRALDFTSSSMSLRRSSLNPLHLHCALIKLYVVGGLGNMQVPTNFYSYAHGCRISEKGQFELRSLDVFC